MATKKPQVTTYYSCVTLHFNTLKVKVPEMVLTAGEGEQLTYSVKDGVVTFTWESFDRTKPTRKVKRWRYPLYNIAWIEEDIDYITESEVTQDD